MLVISQTLRHKKDYAAKRFAAMLTDDPVSANNAPMVYHYVFKKEFLKEETGQ